MGLIIQLLKAVAWLLALGVALVVVAPFWIGFKIYNLVKYAFKACRKAFFARPVA